MTVEEIKSEIDRHIKKCKYNGFDLTCSILRDIKIMLDSLEPSCQSCPNKKSPKKEV